MDLLSVLMHEMGHVLGHDHGDGVMGEALSAGVREGLPQSAPFDTGNLWHDAALAQLLSPRERRG